MATIKQKYWDFSVVVPYFNSSECLPDALRSIAMQDCSPSRIIIIDDCSSDFKCQLVVNDFLKSCHSIEPKNLTVFRNTKNLGLAASYNVGISLCSSELTVLMHPDVVLSNENAVGLLLEPFRDGNVHISGHTNGHTSEGYWKSLTLSQKAVLAPSESRHNTGFNGQFDAFRTSTCLEIGGFDSEKFRTAGEDGDFVIRMTKIRQLVVSDAHAEHRHDFGIQNGFIHGLKKSLQYGNAAGVLARVHGKFLPLYREGLMLITVALAFFVPTMTVFPLLALTISLLRVPILIFKRDRIILHLFYLVPYEGFRHVCHVAGSFMGLFMGRQTI